MSTPKLIGLSFIVFSVFSTGCGPADECAAPAESPGAPAWEIIRDETVLDGAILSVWGTSPDHVFIAGGPLGNTGGTAIAHHFDGCQWTDLEAGGPETFWWVSGTSETDVWLVGEKGRISHYDGSVVSDVSSGTTAPLWGVMAFGPDDAWAVGGTPGAGTSAPNDIVLRWDGASWAQETLPGEPAGVTLYKVWGTSSDDLYVVGEAGTIWHRTESGWATESPDPPVTSRLFTVHGCDKGDVYAVGGPTVLHRDATGWTEVDISLGNQVNGVACGPSGSAVLVGFGGLKQRLVNGAWVNEFDLEPYSDLHAAWADGQGVFWAVGGDWLTMPKDGPRVGIVGRYGPTGVVKSL